MQKAFCYGNEHHAMLAEVYIYSKPSAAIPFLPECFFGTGENVPFHVRIRRFELPPVPHKYLTPAFNRSFFPKTEALVHGRNRRLFPWSKRFL
jgi:hypothetical protein